MALLRTARQYVQNNITRLPTFLNRGLLELNRSHGRVYGASYVEYRGFLRANRLSFDNTNLLLESVDRALRDVPYYRDLYRGRRVESIDAFESLGFIDKGIVRAHQDGLTSTAIDHDEYEQCTTGGTSGPPMVFLVPKSRYVVELATMHSLWEQVGYDHDARAVLRNRRFSESRQYAIQPITREVMFDGFRLGADDLEFVLHKIRQLGIRFVHCYPSSGFELCRFIELRGLSPEPITTLLCGSELVFPHHRELCRKLGVKHYSWYGHSEKLVLAGECGGSADYHVEPTYGYVELVDETGRVIRELGRVGEIVGTSLHNPGMPLIRYRTGDFAEHGGDRCDHCGRTTLLLRNLRGRWNGERIFRSDGTFVTTTALNRHDDVYAYIDGMQYIQERMGELDVLIVKNRSYTSEHEHSMLAHLRERLGPGNEIRIRYVDQLRRAASGKVPFVISSVTEAA